MSFQSTPELEAEVNELISHYPVKRAASLMVLHAIQEREEAKDDPKLRDQRLLIAVKQALRTLDR